MTQLLAYLLEELPAVPDKSQNKGILKTAVGYTGGNPLVTNPSYKLVCGGATDHAEAVKIEFDPSIVSYGELVGVCFSFPFLHSFDGVERVNRVLLSKSRPNNVNRQGGDTGTRKFPLPPSLVQSFIRDTEYRSAIFTHSPEQATTAQRVTKEIQAKYFTPKGKKIVTEIIPAGTWWDAEDHRSSLAVLVQEPEWVSVPVT